MGSKIFKQIVQDEGPLTWKQWPKASFLALLCLNVMIMHKLRGFPQPWLLSIASGHFPLSEFAISDVPKQPNLIKWPKTCFLALFDTFFSMIMLDMHKLRAFLVPEFLSVC